MRSFFCQSGLLAILLFLAACQENRETGSSPQNPDPSLPLTQPEVLPSSDPSLSHWETEVFSAAALEQLEPLKSYLKGKNTTLPPAVSEGLTEFPMDEVTASGAFRVKRAQSVSLPPSELATSLRALRRKFEGETASLVEIKVVRVQLSEDTATTQLNVHLADQKIQINAHWSAEWTRDDPPTLLRLKTIDYEECERDLAGSLVDSTGSVLSSFGERNQIAYSMGHWMSRIETLFGIEMGGWHGIATADVNNDGLDDVYLCDGGGLTNRLLVQQANGTAVDHSLASGLGILDHSFGSLFADFDNDGDQDAAIALVSGVLIMRNDGSGSFSVASAKSFPASVPYSLSAADYDEDGDLDLFASCYVQRAGVNRHSFVARPLPYHDALNGGRNELLRNEGQLRFRSATRAAGMHPGNSRFSYSASWDDYDGDGDLDLYVANDFGSNNLYQSQLRESGKAVFRDVALEAGVRDIAAGMSTCWGDFDNDGLVDLYVGNMFSSAGNRIAFQDQFKPGGNLETRALYQRHARGNSLFKNNGQGSFSDVSVSSGTTMGRWAWSSLFVDLDNNGWEDVLVANGFITQEDTGDL